MPSEALKPWRYASGSDVTQRLAGLGLSAAPLLDAVLNGVRSAQNITSFHPVTARGFMQWSETVASLRQAVVDLDWIASDPQNSPRVTSPDGRTSIMVAGGDAATGVHGEEPSLARKRGPATRRAVQINGQGQFDINLVMPGTQVAPGPATWMLLYHWDHHRPVVHAELSLPVDFTDEGQVRRWSHRILLPEQDLTEFSISQNPGGPHDDVEFGIVELK